MTNARKLKSILVLKGVSQQDLAYNLGISKQALNYKINGRTPFRINEILKIQKILNLNNKERDDIFFDYNVGLEPSSKD